MFLGLRLHVLFVRDFGWPINVLLLVSLFIYIRTSEAVFVSIGGVLA